MAIGKGFWSGRGKSGGFVPPTRQPVTQADPNIMIRQMAPATAPQVNQGLWSSPYASTRQQPAPQPAAMVDPMPVGKPGVPVNVQGGIPSGGVIPNGRPMPADVPSTDVMVDPGRQTAPTRMPPVIVPTRGGQSGGVMSPPRVGMPQAQVDPAQQGIVNRAFRDGFQSVRGR